MKLSIPHPVFARAKAKKTGEDRIAAGIVQSEFEISEFESRDVEPAFSGPFIKPIVKISDRLWRRSDINFTEISRDGLLSKSIDGDRQTSCILADYVLEIHRLATAQRDILMPKPALALPRNSGSISEAVNYLRKIGNFSRRDIVEVDDAAIESWRDRMREFVSGFAFVEGIAYERAHEPMLFVHGHTISQGSAAIFNRHANRVAKNSLGLPEGDNDHWRSNIHVFSFGDEQAASDLADEVSGRPGGGTAQWFTVECLTAPSTQEAVLELEACRFAAIHIAHFDDASIRWKSVLGLERHTAALSDPSSHLGNYARAAGDARSAVAAHHFSEPDFGRVRDALDNLANTARDTEQYLENDQDRYNWEILSLNTDRHLSRLDAFPIAIQVKPGWMI